MKEYGAEWGLVLVGICNFIYLAFVIVMIMFRMFDRKPA